MKAGNESEIERCLFTVNLEFLAVRRIRIFRHGEACVLRGFPRAAIDDNASDMSQPNRRDPDVCASNIRSCSDIYRRRRLLIRCAAEVDRRISLQFRFRLESYKRRIGLGCCVQYAAYRHPGGGYTHSEPTEHLSKHALSLGM